MELVKKYKIALFLDSSTDSAASWVRIAKSTSLEISVDADTTECDYFDQLEPTTEIDSYSISLDQSLTLYKGSPDYEYIFEKFFNLALGENAKTSALIVFMHEPVNDSYKAWKCNATIVLDSLDANNSILSFNLKFNGFPTKGTCKPDRNMKPVFTIA